MKIKKRRLMAVTALLLVLALSLGGTLAYLFDISDPVVNTFHANINTVELTETTGSNYSIVPGTTQEKDPTVIACTTLESYVFLTVTDTTEGMVEYEINSEIWTALEGYEGVYYTVITEDTTLNVLVDNQISYSEDLTNSDMLTEDADGNTVLKDGISLTFQAYIIQTAGFDTVAAAWKQLAVTEGEPVATEDELRDAIAAGATYITLTSDIKLEEVVYYRAAYFEDNEATLNLNGCTLSVSGDASYTGVIGVLSGMTLNIVGEGTIIATEGTTAHNVCIYIQGGTVNIYGGTFINNSETEPCVYVCYEGVANIYGGTFQNLFDGVYKYNTSWAPLTLNSANGTSSRGTIVVYGGTFYGNDPSLGDDGLGTDAIYVAEGYESVQNDDGSYTVSIIAE